MAEVRVENVSVEFGREPVLSDASFDVADGELCVVVGPSGCGKTILLRAVAGLTEPGEGHVYFDGELMNNVAPSDRDVAMCFQTYALYPYMTVRQNWTFPLRAVHLPNEEIQKRLEQVTGLTHMGPLLDRYPRALSGGQQQRVALGRALVRRPRVFLLDEPFGNLDAKLRVELRARVKRMQMDLGITTLHVTHDQVEAQAMGHKLVVMDVGSIQQVGTPEEIYERPVNVFVARFIGVPRMNLITCELKREDGRLLLAHPAFTLAVPPERAAAVETGVTDESVVLGVRPEDVAVSEGPTPGSVPAEVYVLEPQSNEVVIDLSIGDIIVKSRSDQNELGFDPQCNQSVHVTFDSDSVHVFDGKSERRVG
ncbi:MAG: ABC transporter ATP-binding protein [Anaerolineae bacterium]